MSTLEVMHQAQRPDYITPETKNYEVEGPEKVRKRFQVNSCGFEDFPHKLLDVDAAVFHAIGIAEQPDMSLLDIGTSDATFPRRAIIELGLPSTNRIVGTDIYPNQFTDRTQTERDLRIDDALNTTLGELVTSEALSSPSRIQIDPVLELYESSVTDMSIFNDGEFDVVTALFMLYHVPPALQDKALLEIRRVLKAGSLAVFATSGKDNKETHRLYERDFIAQRLGADPPPTMNSGFTTEIAKEILPKYFKHIFELHQVVDVPIKTDWSITTWLESQKTLFDQYRRGNPVSADEFTAVIDDLRDEIYNGGITEKIRRSIYFCTDNDLREPHDISPTTNYYKFERQPARKNVCNI